MLVLSRKKDEAIRIGDNIQVTVLEIRGSRVRLGIKAPDSETIHRLELHQSQLEFGSVEGPVEFDWEAAPAAHVQELVLAH